MRWMLLPRPSLHNELRLRFFARRPAVGLNSGMPLCLLTAVNYAKPVGRFAFRLATCWFRVASGDTNVTSCNCVYVPVLWLLLKAPLFGPSRGRPQKEARQTFFL